MFNKVNTIIASACGLLVLLGAAFGSNAYYAKSTDLKLVEMRLDRKILNDKISTAQDRIWKIEDRYEDKEIPDSVKEELRILKKKLEDDKLLLDNSYKKG